MEPFEQAWCLLRCSRKTVMNSKLKIALFAGAAIVISIATSVSTMVLAPIVTKWSDPQRVYYTPLQDGMSFPDGEETHELLFVHPDGSATLKMRTDQDSKGHHGLDERYAELDRHGDIQAVTWYEYKYDGLDMLLSPGWHKSHLNPKSKKWEPDIYRDFVAYPDQDREQVVKGLQNELDHLRELGAISTRRPW